MAAMAALSSKASLATAPASFGAGKGAPLRVRGPAAECKRVCDLTGKKRNNGFAEAERLEREERQRERNKKQAEAEAKRLALAALPRRTGSRAAEIQRKKEHQYEGSNFESRAFVRTNWKTKNFNPDSNPLEEESSEEEYYDEEYDDEVEDID